MARRSGLGKGLAALIPTTDEGGSALRELPVELIEANGFQPRTEFDDEALAALTASVAELGVLQPILVRPAGDHFELIAGERRLRAAKSAKLATIPAIVREVDDKMSLAQALVENLLRDDLSAIEEAVAYQQLVDDFAFTADEVATQVGKSRPAVANTLRLLQLPEAIQLLVRDRTLTAGHARALLGVEDTADQDQLVQQILDEQLSVRALEKAVRQRAEKKAGKKPEASPKQLIKSAGILEIEERLSDQLFTKVQIVQNKNGRGQIVVHFSGDEDLHRVFVSLRNKTGESGESGET